MINVSDIVADADLAAPRLFQVLRSTGQWTLGGFISTTVTIEMSGPVQRAGDKEVAMLPEADRVSAVMAFWSTQAIYVTRGKLAVPSLHVEVPAGAVPGNSFVLSVPPPGNAGVFERNGLFQIPGLDYIISGSTLTTSTVVGADEVISFSWPTTNFAAPAASDILVYETVQYRVLAVKHYPGSGYFKALGTRMSPI